MENLIWRIWQDIETELKIRKPFSPHFELMASPEGVKLLSPVQQINLPANAPPQVIQQVVQQLLQNAVVDINPVDFELITTVMESRRQASREMIRGKILATRTPDLNLRVNAVTIQAGWEQVNIPAAVNH